MQKAAWLWVRSFPWSCPPSLQGHRDMETVINADDTELQDVEGTLLRRRSESPEYKQGGFVFEFLSDSV